MLYFRVLTLPPTHHIPFVVRCRKLGEKSGIFPTNFVAIDGATRPASGAPYTVVAAFSFDGDADDELSFVAGDEILVTSEVDTEWVQGEVGGSSGIFPSAFVSWALGL